MAHAPKHLNPGNLRVSSRRVGRRVVVCVGLLMVLTGLLATWIGAVGTTLYVDDDTCPAGGSGTLANPYCHIQDAVCVGLSGDTVSVAPGTYHEAVRMKPGVSLISQGGAAVTTIDASGQPCTDNNYCAKRTGNQCTVVTFASGHTLATVLDGFTLTGGAGLIQTTKVAGGGIYVFSSATIVNNVITNNVISGPLPQGGDLRGAGVYIATGQPVVSNNTITGNRAIPPSGTNQALTFGYGGGVWVGFASAPVVTNNVITGNVAGDPNAAYSLGAGGGVVVWPGSGTQGPLIDRNLIADNFTDTLGGGVSLNSLPNTAAQAVVTNNVIVGNRGTEGGGVYTYFNKSTTMNNTIVDNEGFLGGGVYTGQSDLTLPVIITNNIIQGNRLRAFGDGGGIYSLDLSSTFDPVISYNDLWGNDRNQCGGELSDAGCIGVSGNFSADPQFVDLMNRDFHLTAGSPAVDTGTSSGAPATDFDGMARGYDGDGTPNSPQAGDVDVGAYELTGGCVPSAEICDGIDNDCNGNIDEGFPDTDVDGMADCIDPDDDNDLVADAADCAPLDAGAFGSPTEVLNVDVTGPAPTMLEFGLQNIGSATHYQVISGLVSRILVTHGFQEGFCLATPVIASPWEDPRPDPRTGDAWYYLIRSANACGQGTFGNGLRDAQGAGDVCQSGVVDQDADGSPSNLDCNDNDPSLSPINPEICDGLDNNCDQVADEGNPEGGQACGVSNVGECRFGSTMCTSGSLTCLGDIGPGPELCDLKDNDCDGVVDNNVIDSDMDGQDDCVDTDDDNDLVLDTADCAPLDPTAFGVPSEIPALDATGTASTQIAWTDQTLGSGTLYDLASGTLSIPGILDFTSGECVLSAPSSPASDPRPAPAAGEAWYYLIKSRNVCGPGTYGTAGRDSQPACP